MKFKLIILLTIIFISGSFAQTDSLTFQNEISSLKNQLIKQETKVQELYKELDKEYRTYKIIRNQFNERYNNQEQTIDSIKRLININTVNIGKATSELGIKIEDNQDTVSNRIADLRKKLSENTLYWVIAVLVVTILLLIVFILLRKQIFKQKKDLYTTLQDTRKSLEEEGIKVDNKLIEILESQLIIIKNNNSGTEKEIDHSLALKVADEIIRIQKNLTKMDEKTKGLKQLTASVKRIQDNFASNGYELVEMLGKIYNEGMKASVTYNPDSEEKTGVIIRIIKPQVNFEGVMIQSAQIEVSQE